MYEDSVTVDPLMTYILPWGGSLLLIGFIGFIVWSFWRRYQMKQAAEQIVDYVILQVLVPKETEPKEETERRKNFKEIMSVAEQFFASLSALTAMEGGHFLKKQPTLSFEIIAKGAIRFYVGVPKTYRELLEKQIQAYYPTAAIEETTDYEIFDEKLQGAGVELVTTKRFVLPFKTYQELESDPLNNLTNIFSKIGEGSRGALQILIRPTTSNWQQHVFHAAKAIQEGKPPTMLANTWWARALMWFGYGLGEFSRSQNKQGPEPVKLTPMQDEILKDLNEKSSKVGYQVQVRALMLAPTHHEAHMQLGAFTSAFAQFQLGRGNGFKVKRVGDFTQFATDFLLRRYTASREQIFNTAEIASLYHFPTRFTETPGIQWLLARTIAPPVNLPEEGVVLGKSLYRGEEKLVRMKLNDRRRHMYMIGKTGVGKTTLLINMIEQDIKAGHGCAYLDPNGDAIKDILMLIPPERAEDVVLFDPSDAKWPMGLNMLEWKRPEDRDFLVAEWLEIFYKLFDPNKTGMVGPQFEHWGRNASLTIMSIPGGGTLLDIPRLFVDDKFREYAVGFVTDPVVKSFWEQQLAKTSDFHKSEMYNYFISKFGRFMTNDLMRNIIGQTESSFDFRSIMDEGKILLVNLSKGMIGETNSYLLGMVLVSKLQVAAFQRADTPEDQRKDFFLYVDEFQNFTTSTFKTILSEARKYRLNLNITNQYIAQLPEDIRDAVIGNAGTLLSYRIGAGDAEFLEKEFPGVTKEDLTNLTFANLYVKLLIDGTPSKPFSMRGIKTATAPNPAVAEAIRQLCRLKYAEPSARVEAKIQQRLLSNYTQSEPVAVPNDLRMA